MDTPSYVQIAARLQRSIGKTDAMVREFTERRHSPDPLKLVGTTFLETRAPTTADGPDVCAIRHREAIDITPVVLELPTKELDSLVIAAEQARANFRLPRAIVDRIEAHDLLHGDAPRGREERVVTLHSDAVRRLANVVIDSGRAHEMPAAHDALLSLADPDWVDRLQAERDSRLMLNDEPNLEEGDTPLAAP